MVFWDNILRYPRFFVSSMIGLVLTILIPFLKNLKDRKAIFVAGVIALIALFFTLKEMLST